jgi:hypothetical protein
MDFPAVIAAYRNTGAIMMVSQKCFMSLAKIMAQLKSNVEICHPAKIAL